MNENERLLPAEFDVAQALALVAGFA